jgi:hypothetical protein
MARSGVPIKPPIFRTVDWGAISRKAWGEDYHKPDIAYEFSNGRRFNDSAPNGGPYTGTSGNG